MSKDPGQEMLLLATQMHLDAQTVLSSEQTELLRTLRSAIDSCAALLAHAEVNLEKRDEIITNVRETLEDLSQMELPEVE